MESALADISSTVHHLLLLWLCIYGSIVKKKYCSCSMNCSVTKSCCISWPKHTHLSNNALWLALCLIVYIPQSLLSLTNFAAQMQSFSLNRNPRHNSDYALRYCHATLVAHSIVQLQQRKWETVMTLWVQKYTYACKIFPPCPSTWNRAQFAWILSALFPHGISIAENILVLEVLYLHKLTTVKEIYFKNLTKWKRTPDSLYSFYAWDKYIFLFWTKIFSRLFEHHSFHLFKEEIMFVNNSKYHFWFGTTSHLLYI